MASITTYIAGYCTHKACMAVRGAGRQTCHFPAQCTLIHSGDKLWLFDTGYSKHFMDATRHGNYQLYAKVTPVYFNEDDAIIYQLEQMNIKPSDLSAIIISHLHADHIAGLHDFSATPIILSRNAQASVRGLTGLAALKRGFLPDLMPTDIDARLCYVESLPVRPLPEQLRPFKVGYQLDDELYAVCLDGHAAGQVGLFVHTETGWLLLAADAAWSHHNYQGRPPSRLVSPLLDNTRAYHATLGALAVLHAQGVTIHLSHEVHGTDILTHRLDI